MADGIRGSRPLGSGGPIGPPIDDLDRLVPRDDLGLGPLPPVPPDAPGGWFDRNDGLDLPQGQDIALWAYGGQPTALPLAPGDGIDFAQVGGIGGLDAAGLGPMLPGGLPGLDGVDRTLLYVADDVFSEDDGLTLQPVRFDAVNALDGVDSVGATQWLDTDFRTDFGTDFGPGLAALAPALPGPSLDDLVFAADAGVADATLFPPLYATDPLYGDGADLFPDDQLPPPAAPDLDGISWIELEAAASIPIQDDGIFIAQPEALPFEQPRLH